MILRKIKQGRDRWFAFAAMMQHFTPHVIKQKRRLIVAQMLGLGYVFFAMLEPWPLKIIFDNIFLQKPLAPALAPLLGQLTGSTGIFLATMIVAIIAIALVQGIFYYYQQLLTSRAGQQIVSGIRLSLYTHLHRLSMDFHDRRRTGDMLSRLTTDIRILRDILISVPMSVTSEFLTTAGICVIMLFMDAQLTILALLVVPLLAVFLKRYQRPMKNTIREQREREGQLANTAAEVLGAMRVVQGFHQEESETERFSAENKSSLRKGLRAARYEAKLRWASELSVAIVTAVVIGVAAKRVLSGALSPGDILVFMVYLRNFNRPLRRVSRMSERLARATASGERIQDMLKIQPAIQDHPEALPVTNVLGEVHYEHVCFAYAHGAPILNDISLHIRPRERVAIIGNTGSGKTTLVSLLPRFYDPTGGAVYLDGKDIRDLTVASLRRNISLVFQEPILFAATIAENIAYGKPDANPDEIEQAARKAGIHHIIAALPEGYNTALGERGATLSGGQRQCVAIARAMIKDAPIVILDEPTTGLDGNSARLVMNALEQLMENKTVLVISHHLKSIYNMTRVIALRAGEIRYDGTPEDVLMRPDLYGPSEALPAEDLLR